MGIKKKASQTDLVLAWLRAYGTISTLEAFEYLKITRLSARIFDLKRLGFVFNEDRKTSKEGKRYVEYSISYDPKNDSKKMQ